MPKKSIQLANKSTHAKKKRTAKRTVPRRQTVQYVAARLAELPPETLRTLADVVQGLLKSHELGNGDGLFDEEFHRLAGKLAGKNVPTLQQVRRALAKIPGSLTAEFIAERGER